MPNSNFVDCSTGHLAPTLTVDRYMEKDVIHLFLGGYEKIPRTRIGKKRQTRYMGLSM
jgi:hypothetical protein